MTDQCRQSKSMQNHIHSVNHEIRRAEQSIKTDIKVHDKKIGQLREETTKRLDRIEKMLIEALRGSSPS